MEDKDKKGAEKEKEKRNLEVEAERARAVVAVKSAHAEIEKIEKERHQPSVLSLTARIQGILKWIDGYLKSLGGHPTDKAFYSATTEVYEGVTREYHSIRADFQEALDIGDERMGKLFQPVDTDIADVFQIYVKLIDIRLQMEQMALYLLRKST